MTLKIFEFARAAADIRAEPYVLNKFPKKMYFLNKLNHQKWGHYEGSVRELSVTIVLARKIVSYECFS